MQTLTFLAEHQGELVSRAEFFDSVWDGRVVNEEALSRAISVLRSALGDNAQDPTYIQTVPGIGYRLICEVTPVAEVREPVAPTTGESHRFDVKSLMRGADRLLNLGLVLSVVLALSYFVVGQFLGGSGPDNDAPPANSAGKDNSLAVLPFVNMSADPDQDYFADGMTEEILNLLAGVSNLRVTARTSSFFFKGRDVPLPQIAEMLNVRHVLEGSVRKSGDRVRITAQLVEAGTDTHVWSETYDVPLDDVFDIQDAVASAIAKALLESFDGLPRQRHDRPDSLAAFEAYRTGRLLWWQRTPEALEAAIELFNEAVAADPGFAPAYAAIGDSWLLLVLYGKTQILVGVNTAGPMIEKALELDPESAEAIAALGLSRLIIGEKEDAEQDLRRAIALDEDYIPAYVWLAALLSDLGRVPEEGAVLQKALAKDPLNILLTGAYATNLQVRGDTEGARSLVQGQLRMQPDSAPLQVKLSEIELLAGNLVEAWRAARAAYDLSPDNTVAVIALAEAWMAIGRMADAEEVLQTALDRAPRSINTKLEYIKLLRREGRTAEAFAVRDGMFPDDISWLPPASQRTFHQETGLLYLAEGDFESARLHLDLALNPVETHLYDDNQLSTLILVSLLSRELGEHGVAEERLQTAERVIGRARVNGIESAPLYYFAACIFALRGSKERALQALQQAYARGWRDLWRLENDIRLDPLREEPAFQALGQQLAMAVNAADEAVRGM